MKPIKAHMICHTHWDREWYLTKEQFKTKMIRLVDSVLEAAEAAPEHFTFMLDGQTIVLQDYLEIRPENAERLSTVISDERVCVGPWYVLPDELLVSGESHIRNYMAGQRIAQTFGGKMNVAYLPDSFGHPEQMPQIIQGLSMDATVFWRGTDESIEKTEFCWRAPYNGSEILGIHMPYGYGNSARLCRDMEQTIPRLSEMMNQLGARSHSDIVLLMNGSDHILNQHDIIEIIDDFNKQNTEEKYIELSSMQDFLNEICPTLPQLQVKQGEIRSGDRSMLLSGTMSTRVYLKQWNTKVQRQMERYLEPMASIQRLLNIDNGFAGYQNYLWNKILENHPHDSICGCSVDEVHTEMMTRFGCIDQLQKTLLSDAANSLAAVSATDVYADGAQLLCFEPTQDRLPAYIEFTVDFDPMLVQRVNFAQSTIDEYEDDIKHPACPMNVSAYDENGNVINAQLLNTEKAYYMHLQDNTAPEIYKVNRCKVALSLPGMEYGLHTFKLVSLASEKKNDVTDAAIKHIENKYYIVEGDGCGAFRVKDKSTGKVYNGVARLLDKGDAGDEYTYSWPAQDSVVTIDRDQVCIKAGGIAGMHQTLTLQGVMNLPKSLLPSRQARTKETVACPVTITAMLEPESPVISFDITIENNAKDHVLQLEIPSGIKTEATWGSSAFCITSYNVSQSVPRQWMEYPLPTCPTHGLIAATTAQGGVCAMCDGVVEYEAVQSKEETLLRITLLRCVGWLSRPDLNTRIGNGGWVIETPEAQCLGTHRLRVAAMFCTHKWQQTDAFAQCERFLHAPYLQQHMLATTEILIQNDLAGLSQLPSNVRLSAYKLSEDKNGIVLRVYSIANSTQSVCLPLPSGVKQVYNCNLAEKLGKPADVKNQRLRFFIEPWQICSFYFKLC